jgi:hypothetical protein
MPLNFTSCWRLTFNAVKFWFKDAQLCIYISTYKLPFQHRWACLLKQQTSFTVYSLLTQEIKLPFSVSICSKQTEIFHFRFPYIYIYSIYRKRNYRYIVYIYKYVFIYMYICIFVCKWTKQTCPSMYNISVIFVLKGPYAMARNSFRDLAEMDLLHVPP